MIEEDSVPSNWQIKRMSEVIKSFDGGSTPSKSNDDYWGGNIDWATTSDYPENNKRITQVENRITEQAVENTSSKVFGIDRVFVTIIANIGEVAIPDKPMAVNQQTVALLPDKTEVNKEFLYHYIASMEEYLEKQGRGGAYRAINQSHLKSLKIPVPPLDEQERIVEAVEERLERVQRLKKSVENVGRLADAYEDSLLSYLLTGRDLSQQEMSDSEEWFGQIPENWEVKKLKEIGSRVSSMTEPKPDNTYSIYSFDSVDNESGYYEVDGGDIGSRKRELNGGEVMISRLNPRINRVQKVDQEHEYPPIASSEFVAIDLEDSVSREYLYEYLRNPILQERLTNHVTGSTGSRSRVGFDFVMDSNIPVPPKSTQKEIVDNMTKVDFGMLEKSYSDVSNLFGEYRDSVLSHAFRGKVNY